MRELKTWRDVIKAILDGEDVQYMFGDQYMDREKVPCIPINMLDDKTILEHRIKPKQSKLENTVKVLSDDDSLTVAYMGGYYDGKRSTTPEGWQPIESAPKDGTTILVYFRQHGAMTVCWGDHDYDHTSEYATWLVEDHKLGPYPVRGYSKGDDTHWMPLPSPPQPDTRRAIVRAATEIGKEME